MPRKKRSVPLQVSAGVKDTPGVITPAQLRKLQLPGLKKFPRIDPKQIGAAATTLFRRHGPVPSTPVLELTARHPYDPAGWMTFRRIPGWDVEGPLIWMDSFVFERQTGTIGYVLFNAPKKGPYLVVANFTGLASTMTLDGPWGINTGYANTSADAAAAMALWSANAVGAKLGFRVSCASENMSFLRSIQFFEYL